MVSDEVYEMLSEEKGDESFSELIKKRFGKKGRGKGDISRLRRFFGTIDDKTAEAWKREIERGRKSFGRSSG